MNMEMTRTFERMDKDKAWDILVEYMWGNEEAHWIEEGRPNDHIFIALKSLNRFLFCLSKQEEDMEMTRDELNKMTKRELIEHSSQYGVHPNRKDIPKGMLIDLIIHHRFNRPPPKRVVMQRRTLRFSSPPTEDELKQLDEMMD